MYLLDIEKKAWVEIKPIDSKSFKNENNNMIIKKDIKHLDK